MARRTPRIYAVVAYDYYLDPRFAGLSASAETLYIRALGYIKGQRTDGYIPAAALPHLKPQSRTLKRDAKALVSAGLWELEGDGYRVRSWARWNLTNAEQDDLSQKRKKAASKRWSAEKEVSRDAC